MEDDDQDREGEEIGQDVETLEREEDQSEERQRTVRHMMTCVS